MSVRRLHPLQPEKFAFTPANRRWAREQLKKYPKGRQASAVIPLLWRAQEQAGGWLPKPAMEHVAEFLGMAYIRVYEIATFYTMFQLSPVGEKAHVQVCGTTPCMLRGAEDLIKVCKRKIAAEPHRLSADGQFSWEEVECLGACVNAPMVQIFKDTYEDLTPQTLERILDDIAAGKTPRPGPQIARHNSAPEGGPTTLLNGGGKGPATKKKAAARRSARNTAAKSTARPTAAGKPKGIRKPKQPDDLKLISGVGPKIEGILNALGIYRFAQIAKWSAKEIDWVDDYLRFKGRIGRDDWVAQADALAAGGVEEYIRRFGKKPR